MSHQELQVLSYAEKRSYNDPAWEQFSDCPTNYRLADGDKVTLNADTIGDGSDYVIVTKGTTGIVVTARTPKVAMPRLSRSRLPPSLYFANVDVELAGRRYRLRVPHGALTRSKQ